MLKIRKNTFETNSSSYHTLTVGHFGKKHEEPFSCLTIFGRKILIDLTKGAFSKTHFETFQEKVFYCFCCLILKGEDTYADFLERGNNKETQRELMKDPRCQNLVDYLLSIYPEATKIKINFSKNDMDYYDFIDFGDNYCHETLDSEYGENWSEFLNDETAYIYKAE